MRKYNVISAICLGIYITLFFLMMKGVSFGSLGKAVIISLCILPLMGAIIAVKGKKGIGKWLLIILNVIALIIIGYLLLLSGMGEA